MKIPFMDLHRQYLTIKSDVDKAMQDVINSCEFVGGKAKANFEKNFAAACGVKHCVGVGNGTDAIYIALRALGIGAGDEVVVPAMTFIATGEAVTIAGAKPVFVDSDPQTFLMDLNKLEAMLEKRAHTRGGKIRAIIPVHLYGRALPMNRVMDLAQKYNLIVLEDTAQAHLAEWEGKKVGSFGHAATFSFYPGKNLGAYGDAGAVVTNDDKVAEKVQQLANHGRVSKYDHAVEGFNSRLDGLQAAVLDVKLKHLEKWSDSRRQLARRYNEILGPLEGKIQLPHIPDGKGHVFHLYVIRTPNRETVRAELEKKGVQTVVHYPIALPNLQAYAYMGHKRTDFPIATEHQDRVLSLPLFPEMTREEQDFVAQALKSVL